MQNNRSAYLLVTSEHSQQWMLERSNNGTNLIWTIRSAIWHFDCLFLDALQRCLCAADLHPFMGIWSVERRHLRTIIQLWFFGSRNGNETNILFLEGGQRHYFGSLRMIRLAGGGQSVWVLLSFIVSAEIDREKTRKHRDVVKRTRRKINLNRSWRFNQSDKLTFKR